MKNIVLTITCAFIAFECSAQKAVSKQEASGIVKQINESDINAKNFSASLIYRVFSTHTDSLAKDSMSGYYKRSGSNEHSFLLGIETIQNGSERLVVDTGTASIYLSAPVAKPQMAEESMNAAINLCKSMSLKENGKSATLSFYLDAASGTGLSRLDVSYVKNNFNIQSLTLYYLNTLIPGFENLSSPKVEIVYKDTATGKIKDSEFDTKAFLQKKGNATSLTDTYKSYSFFNTLAQ